MTYLLLRFSVAVQKKMEENLSFTLEKTINHKSSMG